MTSFAAIDFETADYGRDSACAVGVVMVEEGRIVERYHQLIRPPREDFVFTYIHGITWDDVRDSPDFAEMWPWLRDMLDSVEFLVAHNALFDKGVLYACCKAVAVDPPGYDFRCTVQLARRTWHLPSNRLPAVCAHLGIDLDHHHALSDAEACARIAIEGQLR
ncbi:MAG: exonuclease [Rhodospirillaceae bacterium]|nr:exonuclease [Rhodospirillaceae bacterium]|tara:strand:+ start:546 stop:1034 length:489 start_codon:yes stop_codon:yes gene_type:complete